MLEPLGVVGAGVTASTTLVTDFTLDQLDSIEFWVVQRALLLTLKGPLDDHVCDWVAEPQLRAVPSPQSKAYCTVWLGPLQDEPPVL